MSSILKETKDLVSKQAAILVASAEEFAECGYEGASLVRIARQAGISKGSLYYYFDDKEDLFISVWEQAMERLMEVSGSLDLDVT